MENSKILNINTDQKLNVLGSIRYISDEGCENSAVNNSTCQKPKRNGVDTDSEDENVTFSRTNGHHINGHHHRSSRKKSKSVRMK